MRIPVLLLVAALGGCAAGTDAIVQTMRTAVGREPSVADRARLNPDFRYLRVTIEGRVALLALGYVDPHPQGSIEVWYSGEREVVRLQNGRLVGTTGLTTEWREVSLPALPDWVTLGRSDAPLRWVRTRDVMPGYRYGVRDALELRVTPPPAKSQLQGLEAKDLVWFEERFEGEARAALPVARYAVKLHDGDALVVYGEQCVAPKTCFTWQRWPAGS